MSNQITLTGIQYLTLQALFKAASGDKSRMALTRIFYDHDHDRFVATDGHILRTETLAWECEPPEKTFLLSKSQVMLSKSQLKLQHGDAKNSDQPLQDIFIPIEYDEYGQDPELIYPAYMNVIPKAEDCTAVPYVGLNPWLLARICRTFFQAPTVIQFRFYGLLRTVLMYKAGYDEDGAGTFAGVVMPCRVTWEEENQT